LVVLFPALLDLEDYYLAPAHAAVATHAKNLGFGVIDLAPDFRAEDSTLDLRTSPNDAIHPSAKGYRIAEAAAWRWFAQQRPWETRSSKVAP
jgi:lysophospholipase L1-like esterase